MALWGHRRGEPGTDLVVQGPVRRVTEAEPPPRAAYDGEDFVWRCGTCGSTGSSYESLHRHLAAPRRGRYCDAEKVREYVPREVYAEEFEATAQELSASGIWIVVKLPETTPEGSIHVNRRGEPPRSKVIEAASGLKAIQVWYGSLVGDLGRDATEEDRDACNGRFVAIDFFTGHRAEALIESEWRANVDVAAGSHA